MSHPFSSGGTYGSYMDGGDDFSSDFLNFTAQQPEYYQEEQPADFYSYPNYQEQPAFQCLAELQPYQTPDGPTLDLAPTEQYLQTLKTELDSLVSQQTIMLKKLKQDMHNKAASDEVDQIYQRYTELAASVNSTIHSLREARFNLLEANENEFIGYLIEEYSYLNEFIDVMGTEIQEYFKAMSNDTPVNVAAFTRLYITKQPFPNIWMKKNQLLDQEVVNVKLLKGSASECSSLSHLVADIDCHTPYGSKTSKPKPLLENHTGMFDNYDLNARMQFGFLGGTRKDVACVRFHTQVTIDNQVVQLRSHNSHLFVVMTNECQYEESLGILFTKDVLESLGQDTVPIGYFMNSIQSYFIKGLRLDAHTAIRPLTSYDMQYMQANFFGGSSTVSRQSFSKFWSWFGKVLHRIRYQRHMTSLWCQGLIYGMISRDAVHRLLMSRPDGSFMLRFSESFQGSIAVAYRVEGGVKNYLIKQEDTLGNAKSVADFLKTRPEFLYMLQYTGQHDADGLPVLYLIEKDVALRNYYSAKPKTNDPKGNPYDDL